MNETSQIVIYRPALLCGEGARTVDPLSLYLSLRDDPDERVQAALKELLEAMQWYHLKSMAGARLHLPADPALHPASHHLAWHRRKHGY